jgi:hypothetical protein
MIDPAPARGNHVGCENSYAKDLRLRIVQTLSERNPKTSAAAYLFGVGLFSVKRYTKNRHLRIIPNGLCF